MSEMKHTNPMTESEIRELAKPFIRQCGDHWSCQEAIPEDLLEDFVRAVETKKDQQLHLVLNSHDDMLAALKKVRGWMVNAGNDRDNSVDDYVVLKTEEFYVLLSSIDAAIAKAKGGAK